MRKQYSLVFVGIGTAAFILLIFVLYMTYQPGNGNLINVPDQQESIPTRTPEQIKNAEEILENDVVYWELFDTSKNPRKPTGVRFKRDATNPTVVRWNNYLLSINEQDYIDTSGAAFLGSPGQVHYTIFHYIPSIHVYDIDKGTSFEIPLDQPLYGEIWYTTSQVVDNTYYFGTGGAFGPTLQYAVPLPPTPNSRITKLAKNIGSEIHKYGNVYISSDCYEGCMYELFHPNSRTTTPLPRMLEAGNTYVYDRKEKLIGIDSRGNMIINIQDIPDERPARMTTLPIYDSLSIASVPLTNEKITNTLMTASEMPEKIYHYTMIDNTDIIVFLAASSGYTYHIPTGTIKKFEIGEILKKMIASKNVYKYASYAQNGGTICFADGKGNTAASMIEPQTYIEPAPEECNKNDGSHAREDIISNLNLPDHLQLQQVSVVYSNPERE